MFLWFANMEVGCLNKSSFSILESLEDRLEWFEEWVEAEEQEAVYKKGKS